MPVTEHTRPNDNLGSFANYKEKYSSMKTKLKAILYENELFQDELKKLQRELLDIYRDKETLLHRISQYEDIDSSSSDSESQTSDNFYSNKVLPGKKMPTIVKPLSQVVATSQSGVQGVHAINSQQRPPQQLQPQLQISTQPQPQPQLQTHQPPPLIPSQLPTSQPSQISVLTHPIQPVQLLQPQQLIPQQQIQQESTKSTTKPKPKASAKSTTTKPKPKATANKPPAPRKPATKAPRKPPSNKTDSNAAPKPRATKSNQKRQPAAANKNNNNITSSSNNNNTNTNTNHANNNSNNQVVQPQLQPQPHQQQAEPQQQHQQQLQPMTIVSHVQLPISDDQMKLAQQVNINHNLNTDTFMANMNNLTGQPPNHHNIDINGTNRFEHHQHQQQPQQNHQIIGHHKIHLQPQQSLEQHHPQMTMGLGIDGFQQTQQPTIMTTQSNHTFEQPGYTIIAFNNNTGNLMQHEQQQMSQIIAINQAPQGVNVINAQQQQQPHHQPQQQLQHHTQHHQQQQQQHQHQQQQQHQHQLSHQPHGQPSNHPQQHQQHQQLSEEQLSAEELEQHLESRRMEQAALLMPDWESSVPSEIFSTDSAIKFMAED